MKPWFFTILLSCIAGCLAPAVYRTAHMLPKDEWDLALGLTAQQVTTEAYTADRGTVSFPRDSTRYVGILPEISWHYGVQDDIEVGGRLVASASMAEVDAKYRLLGGPASQLHVAVQPALGGRLRHGGKDSIWANMEGYHLTLPILTTYDISPSVAATGSVFTLLTSYRDKNAGPPDMVGDMVYGGGSLSLRVQEGTTFYTIPFVEMQRSVWRRSRHNNEPAVTVVVAGLGFGWGAPSPPAVHE